MRKFQDFLVGYYTCFVTGAAAIFSNAVTDGLHRRLVNRRFLKWRYTNASSYMCFYTSRYLESLNCPTSLRSLISLRHHRHRLYSDIVIINVCTFLSVHWGLFTRV